jgi:sugar phosphate isomerase/epimerase
MNNKQMLITDWGAIDRAIPIATWYQVGLEVQEFTSPRNLDAPHELLEEIVGKTRGLTLKSMHGAFSDLVPASRDPLIRQATRERFLQAVSLAQQMGVQHLILHSGYIPKTYPAEQWLRNSLEFWMELLNQAYYEGEIHVENVYEDDFTNLRELIDKVNQDFQARRLSICLDIGHVNANSTKKFEEWIPGLGKRIRYVHIHNNGGALDDHWRLDQGTIPIEQVLNLLMEHAAEAAWTVETPIEAIEPSLEWLKVKGYLSESA